MFKEKGIIFQIGVAPCRIDIITEISGGIEFTEANTRSIKTEIAGVYLNILSIGDLIKNKEAIGRPKDIEDVKMLKNKS